MLKSGLWGPPSESIIGPMATDTTSVKQQARQVIDELPDDATWDDVVYELTVRRSIELGLADVDAGRLASVNEVRRQFRPSG